MNTLDAQHDSSRPSRASVRRSWIFPVQQSWWWVLLAALLCYQGWLRGVNLVALLGSLMLGLWVVNGFWVYLRRLKRLKVSRAIDGPVFAGEPVTVTLELANPTRRIQPAVRVEDHGRNHRIAWFVPRLERGETQRHRQETTLLRRGKYAWPELRLSTGYPFGLFRRTVRFAADETTIVLPRLGKLHQGRLRRLLWYWPRLVHATQRPRRRHPVAQTDFYGLREFRPGDSPRWIHWRTSARVGELMVREFEEPPLDNLTVIVDPWLPEAASALQSKWDEVRRANQTLIEMLLASGPPPPPEKRRAKEAALARKEEPFRVPLERLETALSLAATIAWLWHRQPGAEVAVAVSDAAAGVHVIDNAAGSVVPLLEALAVVEGGPVADTAALLDRLATQPLPPGPLLLVTTRTTDLADRIAARLDRHVAVVDVSQPSLDDLFEKP